MDKGPLKIGCKSYRINLIQTRSKTTHCAKLGLMGVQKSYIDASSAQVTVPGLFGGFFFRGLKKLRGGNHESTAKRTEHSRTEFRKKNSEQKFGESETCYQSKFSRATGVKVPFHFPIPAVMKLQCEIETNHGIEKGIALEKVRNWTNHAAAALGSAPQPQSHGPAQDTSAASDNNIFSHCIIAEDNNSFHNWDAGLQFLSENEISGKLFELCDFTLTSVLPVGKDHTKFSNCMKKVLVLADIFQDSIRVRDTQRHLTQSLPTLLISHGFKMIQTRCNHLLKGDLEWPWASCTKLGRARQTRLAANPHTGKAHTVTQSDALAQKLARAGNFSKSCQTEGMCQCFHQC